MTNLVNLYFKKSFCILLITIICLSNINAQIDSVELIQFEKPKKKYNLTFRIDNSLNDINFKNNLYYEGEYLKSNPEEYIWKTYDSTLLNYNDFSRLTNFKFDLMISISKPLNIGFSYHLLNIQTQEMVSNNPNSTATRTEFYPFFALAGVVDYKLAIKPVKRLYINPSISMGTYQSVKLFTGIGKEWYTDLKLAVLYNIGKKETFGVRLYGDYSNWLYREKRTSRPFPDRNRIVKANLSSINFGFGLAYRFILIPD